MTAKQLISEMQRHIVRHPEAADFPVVFLGSSIEDATMGLPELQVAARVVLDLREGEHRFVLDGQALPGLNACGTG